MQLTYDRNTSTVWIFATPNELMQLSVMAQQKIIKAKLGESLTIFDQSINQSNLFLKISAS